MSREQMSFWERAATAALTGLCVNAGAMDCEGAARLAAQLADALLAEKEGRG